MNNDQCKFSIRLDKSLLAELDSYAEGEGKNRTEAVRELLVYALADKKADIYSSPIADMVTRIMRSELVAFRRAQDEIVEGDRELILDTFSEILSSSSATLLFLTSLIAQPGSERSPEELYELFRAAGSFSAAGYSYDDALAGGEGALKAHGGAVDDVDAW